MGTGGWMDGIHQHTNRARGGSKAMVTNTIRC